MILLRSTEFMADSFARGFPTFLSIEIQGNKKPQLICLIYSHPETINKTIWEAS